MVGVRYIIGLYLWYDALYDGIGCIFSLWCADTHCVTDIALVERDRCHEYFVGFCISGDLVFVAIFGHDTDTRLEWYLLDNLVFDPTMALDRCLESAPLYEE